ncbi:TRAP transporter substrate-binding protein DctP [Acrocarpospora pleiomorpha]|nr:TRAP transporter substrate-binding protein DctP [Acrocarpospora pleiomorpha]
MRKGGGGRRRSRLLVAGASVAGLLVLAACGGGSGSGSNEEKAESKGVQVGATKDAYIAAFADVDPVQLTAQSINAPEHYYSQGLQAYADALKEWSGGKITVNLQFAAAVAPPAEADAALADGRLDIAAFFPSYATQKYPVYNGLNTIGFGMDDPLAGLLAWDLSLNDSLAAIPELQEEMKKQGIHLLLPSNLSDVTAMGCTSDRSSPAKAKGGIARTAGVLENAYIEAIGMSPASMPFTEVFEALQRGTVDCTLTALAQAKASGYLDIAKFWAVGKDRPAVMHPLAFSEARWKSLPLVAQQLLWDRLDVLYEAQLRSVLAATSDALKGLGAAGGTVSSFSEDAVAAFQPVKQQAYDAFKASGVVADTDGAIKLVQDNRDKWLGIASGAGLSGVEFEQFAGWYAEHNDVDLAPVVEQVRANILAPLRPGA